MNKCEVMELIASSTLILKHFQLIRKNIKCVNDVICFKSYVTLSILNGTNFET